MSGNQPATPQRREIEIMRVLFERRLKDRAIALADSRWPGSGKMVDLAYEWGQLEPTERRERLSAIGPEEIARLREFAELNPELSKAVTELDRRGVLPHIEAAALDAAEAAREAQTSEQTAAESAPTTAPDPVTEPPQSSDDQATSSQSVNLLDESPPNTDAPHYDFEDSDISKLNVDMPELDLGLPSTSEFLSTEADRRQDANQAAEAVMDRVRNSLDQAARRTFDRSASIGMPKIPDIPRPTAPTNAAAAPSLPARPKTRPAVDAPTSLARHLKDHVVAIISPGDPVPTIDQLVSLANDLQLGFTEHSVRLGNRKEAFGGLVSEFGRIRVEAGSIPRAAAGPNLVVIHGRLAPQIADRVEEGYFDIPGTRATVEVHPKAKVVVLSDR